MSSLQSLQQSCRLSRPIKCGCTNCAELVEEQVAPERSNSKLSKGSDVLPSGPGEDNFTKLLGPARGTSLSGLQIWIDLGDISEDKDSEIAAVASTRLNSGLVADKALRRCGEESDRLQVVSTMAAQSSTNYGSYDVVTSRTFAVGVGSGSSSVVGGSHRGCSNHRTTGDRVKADLTGAKVKKERSLKRVRFSDHNVVYFIPLPECDTDEDDMACDIAGRLQLDSVDYEAHGSTSRLDLEFEKTSIADEESGSREGNALPCGNHCVDSVITDRVASLSKQTDELGEDEESRAMEMNGLDNAGKPGGISKALNPVEDSVDAVQLLKELVAFCDGKSEKGVSHAHGSSRLHSPVRVKVESPAEQEYAITCRNEPELESVRSRNEPQPVQAHASSSGSRDREFEDAKRDLELLMYDVDRMYALDPAISPSYGRAQRWSMVDFSEDSWRLTFKRKVNPVKKKKGLKRAKRSDPSLSGGVDCSTIRSDDLEAEDDLLGRPVWMRQYKSVNALVS